MVQQQAIYFHFLTPRFYFPDRSRLKQFIEQLFRTEGFKIGTINYILCSDKYLLHVNRTYLNHDYYTDIITFPFSQPNEPISSDIYISVDRVKANALSLNVPFKRELHRVMFHGALHLCGYKDKKQKEVELMRQKEDFYLNRYFVPRGTSGNIPMKRK